MLCWNLMTTIHIKLKVSAEGSFKIAISFFVLAVLKRYFMAKPRLFLALDVHTVLAHFSPSMVIRISKSTG